MVPANRPTGRIRPGEWGTFLILGVLIFANSFALEIAEVVSVSGFLSDVDTYNIILVWIVDMLLIMVTASLQTLIIDRYNRVRLMAGFIIVIMGTYLGLWLLFLVGAPDWLNFGILFILGDQQWLFFPLLFWVLANDIYDLQQAKRLFPLIIALGFVGQVLGAMFATGAANILNLLGLSINAILTLNAGIFLGLAILAFVGLGRVRIRKTTEQGQNVREVMLEGWEFVKAVPAFRYMIVTYIGLAVAVYVVRYHFLVVSAQAYTTAADYQQFYGTYRMVLLVGNVLVSTYATSRIIDSLELKRAFLISPILMVALMLVLFVANDVILVTVVMILTWLLFYTIDQPSRKAFQSLVPEERRGRVSMFMDSYVLAFGALVASVIIGIVVLLGEVWAVPGYYFVYLAVGVMGTVAAVWSAMLILRSYDKSMLNWRMKRRQRRTTLLDQLDL